MEVTETHGDESNNPEACSNDPNNPDISCDDSISSGSNQDDKGQDMTDVKPARDSTFFNTLMNLINSLIGAGILSVPNSFASAGIIPSIIIITAISYLCYLSSLIDIRLVQKIECTGFDELIDKVIGKWGSVIYSIVVIIFLFASMIAYLIIGCDTIVSWFSFAGINCSQFKYRVLIILIYSIFIPVALMIPKNFFLIGIFSTASIFCVILYSIATIIKAAQFFSKHSVSKTMELAKLDVSIFSAIGVYALTFSLPTVVITLLNPFSPDYKKRRNVVMTCFIITSVLTIFPSILQYLMFGAETEGNILNSYPSDDILFTVVRAGFFLIVSFSFPVCGKSAMYNWSNLIFSKNNINELKRWEYVVIFLITTVVPILLAMLLPQCKPIIAVGGAFGGCLACYAFPSILWVKASEKKWTDKSNIGYVAYAVFGVAIAVASTYQSIMDAISSLKGVI